MSTGQDYYTTFNTLLTLDNIQNLKYSNTHVFRKAVNEYLLPKPKDADKEIKKSNKITKTPIFNNYENQFITLEMRFKVKNKPDISIVLATKHIPMNELELIKSKENIIDDFSFFY